MEESKSRYKKKWTKPKIREIEIEEQVGILGCSKANWVTCTGASCGGETQT